MSAMSTVQEIRDAIAKLPELQRFELMHLLHSQYEGDDLETDEMLAEAAEGERQIDAGEGIPLQKARKLTRTWITR
jgi:hypothetical protein